MTQSLPSRYHSQADASRMSLGVACRLGAPMHLQKMPHPLRGTIGIFHFSFFLFPDTFGFDSVVLYLLFR